jgi:hypothetical protein
LNHHVVRTAEPENTSHIPAGRKQAQMREKAALTIFNDRQRREAKQGLPGRVGV